jgi:hypothetical protein
MRSICDFPFYIAALVLLAFYIAEYVQKSMGIIERKIFS